MELSRLIRNTPNNQELGAKVRPYVTEELSKKYPNDADLGYYVRTLRG